ECVLRLPPEHTDQRASSLPAKSRTKRLGSELPQPSESRERRALEAFVEWCETGVLLARHLPSGLRRKPRGRRRASIESTEDQFAKPQSSLESRSFLPGQRFHLFAPSPCECAPPPQH